VGERGGEGRSPKDLGGRASRAAEEGARDVLQRVGGSAALDDRGACRHETISGYFSQKKTNCSPEMFVSSGHIVLKGGCRGRPDGALRWPDSGHGAAGDTVATMVVGHAGPGWALPLQFQEWELRNSGTIAWALARWRHGARNDAYGAGERCRDAGCLTALLGQTSNQRRPLACPRHAGRPDGSHRDVPQSARPQYPLSSLPPSASATFAGCLLDTFLPYHSLGRSQAPQRSGRHRHLVQTARAVGVQPASHGQSERKLLASQHCQERC